MSTTNDPLIERVRFDIIGKTHSGHELRAWTDGDRVCWQDDEGRSGYIPAMLFRLAAHAVAHYCEDVTCAEDSGFHDDFVTMWADSVCCPIDLAMAHPFWSDPDDVRNDHRFGFESTIVSTALDAEPEMLKPRN